MKMPCLCVGGCLEIVITRDDYETRGCRGDLRSTEGVRRKLHAQEVLFP